MASLLRQQDCLWHSVGATSGRTRDVFFERQQRVNSHCYRARFVTIQKGTLGSDVHTDELEQLWFMDQTEFCRIDAHKAIPGHK